METDRSAAVFWLPPKAAPDFDIMGFDLDFALTGLRFSTFSPSLLTPPPLLRLNRTT
jgi:hypothetical protein